MEKAMKHLDKSFGILSSIPVSHENVERMALAKQELRAAYAALEAAKKDADEKAKKGNEVSKDG